MTDVTVQTVRRRIKHVESTINTVTNHLEDGSPDCHALIQGLGLLEQVNADLSELEADLDDLNHGDPSEESRSSS